MLNRRDFMRGMAACVLGSVLTGCSISDVEETAVLDTQEKSEKSIDPDKVETITWYYFYGRMSREEEQQNRELEKTLSRKLQEKGLPVEVVFKKYDEFEFSEKKNISLFEEADILFVPPNFPDYDSYAVLARKGKLACWDPYLQSTEGIVLRKCFPEKYWKGTEVDGKVYALLTPSFYLKTYYSINKKIADKYGIREEDLSEENMNALVSRVYQEEKRAGNEAFIGLEATQFDRVGPHMFYPLTSAEEIGVYKDDGKWKATFLVDIPEYQSFIRKMNGLYLEGAYQAANEQRLEGNFFAMYCPSYSKKGAAKRSLTMLKDKTFGEEDFWIKETSNCPNHQYRGNGSRMAVWEASPRKSLAMKVLATIYGDAELSELINYGIEGKNWRETDGGKRIECLSGDYSRYFGNLFLMRPSTKEDENRVEDVWNLIEQESSPLCGFHLDISGAEETWERIVSVQLMYMDTYYSGISDSIDEEEEKIREQLKAVGGYSVLKEIEEQLNRFSQINE